MVFYLCVGFKGWLGYGFLYETREPVQVKNKAFVKALFFIQPYYSLGATEATKRFGTMKKSSR